jgi:hypothetical protein
VRATGVGDRARQDPSVGQRRMQKRHGTRRAGLHDVTPTVQPQHRSGGQAPDRSTGVVGDQHRCAGGQARQQPPRQPLAPIEIKPSERLVEQQGVAARLGRLDQRQALEHSFAVTRRRRAQQRRRKPRVAYGRAPVGGGQTAQSAHRRQPLAGGQDPASTTFSPTNAQRAGRRTLPARGADSPASTRRRLVLPLPLAPARCTTCPRLIARLTSDSTTRRPRRTVTAQASIMTGTPPR